MLNGFLGLRHDTVIGRDNQDNDIGRLGAAGSHGGKRRVARGIEEGHDAVVGFDMVGADMLGDTAFFTGRHLGPTNMVQQRGLAVVDVAHDGDHRRTGNGIFFNRFHRH